MQAICHVTSGPMEFGSLLMQSMAGSRSEGSSADDRETSAGERHDLDSEVWRCLAFALSPSTVNSHKPALSFGRAAAFAAGADARTPTAAEADAGGAANDDDAAHSHTQARGRIDIVFICVAT